MAPGRHSHLLPFMKSLKPEVQQPLRLLLLAGNEPYDILVQALWNELLLNVGDKALLIFARIDLLYAPVRFL